MSSTILNLTQRATIDGTEFAVLATAGANWKGALGTQKWTFGGLAVNGQINGTTTLGSGSANSYTVTQNAANSSDTNDTSLFLSFNLLASSATNELVCRVFKLNATNTLTGGGVVSALRAVNVGITTASGATTTNMEAIYIEDNSTLGTVTTAFGLRVASLSGSTKWGYFDDSGANEYTAGSLCLNNFTAGVAGSVYTGCANPMIGTRTAYTNGAGTGSGVTFTNAPGASGATGNPTKWIPVDDNGTTRYIPAF